MTEPTTTSTAMAEPAVAAAPSPAAPPAAPGTNGASSSAPGQMPTVAVRDLIEAGVHFGHQTNRWNPKMAPYIYGPRNGIHIIDLDQTVKLLATALAAISQAVSRGGQVLFVGTKRQAQEVIREEAVRAGQFHVTGRWLGGTLTNFRTIKHSIDRLHQLEQMAEDGTLETLPKRERVGLGREEARLTKYLGGIKDMNGPPAVLFVIDPVFEHIAVREANKLDIPVAALTDTNCDPQLIDMLIPGNDDAIRAIRLVTAAVADACLQGRSRRREMHGGSSREDSTAGVQVEFARGSRMRRPSQAPAPVTDEAGSKEGD